MQLMRSLQEVPMITNKRTISYNDQYLRCQGLCPQKCAFFDIETTGFRANTSHLYLIGAAVWQMEDTWLIFQWMGERPQEETVLLRSFADFMKNYDTILHFNGDRFDIPYLEEKYEQYQIPSPFSEKKSVDLYQDFRPLKSFLKLERMNQKSLETFLGLNRDDQYDGGQLIPLYREFCKTFCEETLGLLLLHNQEDVAGMFTLTSLYGYVSVFQNSISPLSGELLTNRNGCQELLLSFSLPVPVPVPVSHSLERGYLTLQKNTGKLLIPILQDTLYYFFPDYKNYYYLPQEDQAIHKNVAAYVDKQYRQPAKASNCYIKQEGRFLPQPKDYFTPAFRRSHKDAFSWFLWKDEYLQDSEFLKNYPKLLLESLGN